MTLATVFVSSTSLDLADYREAVRRACDELGLGVVGMEDFEAADLDAVRASLAKLDRAVVYLGVFAYRYGFVPPGESRSVTEQEFDHATARGVERLCFLVDPRFAWPEERKQHDMLDRVRALHEKVRGAGLVIDTFTTPDDLKHVVFLALQRWLERRGLLGPRQVRPPAPDFVGREADLRALLERLDRGATITGLHGQGGVGKTELALKLAALVGERYRDGHVFLDLRGVRPRPAAAAGAATSWPTSSTPSGRWSGCPTTTTSWRGCTTRCWRASGRFCCWTTRWGRSSCAG